MKLPNILKEIGGIADKEDINAFVVGGFVRDLLFGAEDIDIDIVVEANAINFAKVLSKEWGVGLVSHEGFRTATMKKAGYRIDVATARKERYKKPAALPEIKAATIKEDLFRRDFTINAMAVSLNKANFSELVDFYGGRKDLESKKIRILHDRSFIDDPTRIFRAVKFARRLKFEIEPHTMKLLEEAVSIGMAGKLKTQRIKKEMDLILKERDAQNVISTLKSLGAIN